MDEFAAGMNGAGLPHSKLFFCFVEDANVQLVDAREGLSEPNLATGKEGLLNRQNAKHSDWLVDSDIFHHDVIITRHGYLSTTNLKKSSFPKYLSEKTFFGTDNGNAGIGEYLTPAIETIGGVMLFAY